ncbi:MAG TPA: ROK family glucokinase [Candidatus Atopostipes pullistercoris]|uniref:Glucokinase n=1 Tax=Candidatus Atopostipes pullistercoris TaxID=2838467 RepID=A0A9D2G1E5_9LACT|nr:ROK family glucokinase [Candidatus Atopostipes pullistercoris]
MLDKKVIGIDLGGTTAKCAILNTKGEIQTKWSIETDISEEGSKIVPNLIDSINHQLERFQLTAEDFIGIGMGSPGTVNRVEGTVIGAYNLNWKTMQPVREQIEKGTGIPFFIDNDANVAALGEQWVGAGNNEPDVVFVTLGTGVGGGLISDGKLLHGAIDAAGEIGHVTVEPDGYLCTCGKKGCLEQYASATGVVHLARDLSEEYAGDSQLKYLIDDGQKVDAKIIFDLANEGDALAEMIVDRFAYYLGFALANIANLLNPSTIVLGGGVSKAGEFLAEKVRKVLIEFSFPTIREVTKVKIAELGNDAGVIGAASLVLNEIEDVLK